VVTWVVLVYTANDHGAGTDANVQMVIYGKNEKGESIKSDEIALDNSGDNFESGQEDQFKIETIDVGRPYKIRVWHDNAGSFAAWKLDRVSFYALHAMQTRSSHENSVCPSVCLSVCLSVKRVICDKMEKRSLQIFIPCERSFSLVF